MDITSFHPDQRDWSSTRAHRAPILTLWSLPAGSAPTYSIGYLLFNGRLILDYAGKPIRAFRNLPLTISSAVKGFRLETWIRQEIHRLRIEDIRARMRTRNTPNGRVPLFKAPDLTDRANAFRLKSGLITFRPHNDPIRFNARGYIDSLRTPAQKASNLATDRDLTRDQLTTLKQRSKRNAANAAAGARAMASLRAPAAVSAPTTGGKSTSRRSHRRRPKRRGHKSTAAGSSARANVSAPAAASTPVTTVTPTPRRSNLRRPSPTPQPGPRAPLPPPTPTQTLPDSRNDVPETCKESYTLTAALRETVEHFKKLTGQNPKQTKPTESYSSQWNALQAQFAPIWKSQRPAEETPLLYKHCAWTGGIGCWDLEVRLEDEERNREGERFGAYMDAAQEGRGFLESDGTWRSVRDTWCNSHAGLAEVQIGREESASEGGSEEGSGEDSEDDSDEDSEEGSEGSEENSEESPVESSDADFDGFA